MPMGGTGKLRKGMDMKTPTKMKTNAPSSKKKGK